MIQLTQDSMDFAFKFSVILATCLLYNCFGVKAQTVDSPAISFSMKTVPEQPNQLFELNQNRVLKCIASAEDASQRPVLTWYFEDQNIPADRNARVHTEVQADGSTLLRIKNVQESDKGLYKCVATLGSQTDDRTIRAEVYQKLQITSPKEQWGLKGRDGEVKCEAISKPPATLQWKFDDGSLIQNSDKYIIQQGQLTIKNLEDSDARTYLCDIDVIEIGTSEQLYIDYLVVTPPVIPMPPIISPNNPKEGDPVVQMRCEASGNPRPTFEFKKGDRPMEDDKVDKQNGILTLRDMKREDEGMYTCVAKNIGGSDEKSNKLDIKIPPILKDIPDVKDAIEGGQERVTCIAEGDPAPTVVWQKVGMPDFSSEGVKNGGPELVDEGGTDREDAEIKTVGKTMIFHSIRPQDAGAYTCTALNIVGNASKTIKFEVKYKPNFNTDFKETVFYGWKGHTANLTCLASANELADILWYEMKDNRTVRIENTAPYTIATLQSWPDYYLSSSSLLVYISDENSPVFKDYTCEARNALGVASQTVTLRRAEKPGQPIVRVSNILSTKAIIEFDAPSNTGGQPVTGYHYFYFPSSEQNNKAEYDIDSTLPTTTVELKDLKPKTGYVISVAARNVVGLGSYMTITFETKDVSKPLPLVILSPSESPDPTTYTLAWDNPDDGGSPITHIVVTYRRMSVKKTNDGQLIPDKDLDQSPTTKKLTDTNARSITLSGLERDSYYDIRVIAINKEGESPEAYKLIKTSASAAKGTDGGSANLTVNVTSAFLLLILACLSTIW